MQLRNSERQQAKIKMALQGPSGSGKTMSALLLAFGLTGDYKKVAVIDTENKSADLYAHLGNYKVIAMEPPYSPERYAQAIEVCEKAEMKVVIIDGISHCWDFLVDYHASLQGNDFVNWNKVKPRQRAFMDKILQSDCHIISTIRVKQDYVLNQKDGKYIPEKVGLKAVAKEGTDYELTIVINIDMKHNCISSKDRTGLFTDKPEFVITSETGKKINEWCNSGVKIEDVRLQIQQSSSVDQLIVIYKKYTSWYHHLENDFVNKRRQLQSNQSNNISNLQNFSQNETAKNQ